MHKIVNLETFFIPEDEKYNLLKKEIGDSNKILGLMLADGFIHENPGSIVEKISNEVDLTIVAGLASGNTEYKKVVDFNFNLHTTYNSYKSRPTKNWNPSSSKFLFLGGVPSRPNRIGLLNKFRKYGLLEKCEWSFFPPWTVDQEEWCKCHLKEDYFEVLKLSRKIDSVYESSKHYGTNPSKNEWTRDTAWIDPLIFNNTLLSIVSEGISDSDLSSDYLTEKTYRVFVQRHPFLHASNPNMFKYIKHLGFKTFEEYMKIRDYAYLSNENERLEAIVENTEYFLKNFKSNQTQIEQDINFNYDRFFTLAKENIVILNSIMKNFNIEKTDIDKWFNQKGFSHLVRVYGN